MIYKIIDWIHDKIIYRYRRLRVIELTEPIYVRFNRNGDEDFAVINLDLTVYKSRNLFCRMYLNPTLEQINKNYRILELSNDKSDFIDNNNSRLKYRFTLNGHSEIYYIIRNVIHKIDLNQYFIRDFTIFTYVNFWQVGGCSKERIITTNLFLGNYFNDDDINKVSDSYLYYSYDDAKNDLDMKLDYDSRKREIDRLRKLSQI